MFPPLDCDTIIPQEKETFTEKRLFFCLIKSTTYKRLLTSRYSTLDTLKKCDLAVYVPNNRGKTPSDTRLARSNAPVNNISYTALDFYNPFFLFPFFVNRFNYLRDFQSGRVEGMSSSSTGSRSLNLTYVGTI